MSDEKVDLNQADVDELAALPGIGEKLAARIIEHREGAGRFLSVADLAAVPGISEQMVRQVEDRLVVEPIPEEGMGPEAEPEVEEIIAGEEEAAAADEEIEAETAMATELEAEIEEEAPEPEPESEEFAAGEEEVAFERDLESEIIMAPAPGGEALMVGEEPTAIPEAEGEEVEPLAATPGLAPTPPPPSADQEKEPSIERQPETVTKTESLALTGCISALAGAFLGAILVLVLLFFLNGTLRFAGNAQAAVLRRELDQEIETLNLDQGILAGDVEDQQDVVDALSGQVATMTAMQETVMDSLTQAQTDVSSLQDEVDQLDDSLTDQGEDVTALQETAAQLDERLVAVAASAENFDVFLNNLRDILFRLQGPPPSPTATLTLTATVPTAGTKTPLPTSTPMPTRTPRPTATPLTLPRPTPTR